MKILALNLIIVAIILASRYSGQPRLAQRIAALRPHRPAGNLNSHH